MLAASNRMFLSSLDKDIFRILDINLLPDGRMLVTEQAGRLRIIDHGKLLPEPVRGIPAVYGGEGGLLDVVLHPNYSRPGNDWIYLSYGDKSPGGLAMTAVIRGRLRDGAFVDQQPIFKAPDSSYRVGGQRFRIAPVV